MGLGLNPRLGRLRPSGIRRVSQLAAATEGCVSLTLGEPGEDTPAVVCDQVARDLTAGLTHYPPNNGVPALRVAIARHMTGRGEPCEPERVIVTNGATEALYVALTTLIEPGDEVVIPAPAFSLYESIVTLQGARPVLLDTTGDRFQITREALASVVTERTKAIVLTSPNNPTGCVLDAASLDAVADCARGGGVADGRADAGGRAVGARSDAGGPAGPTGAPSGDAGCPAGPTGAPSGDAGCYVVCDDVYDQLVYDSSYQTFAQRHPQLADRTVVVNSFSKPYAMTGWRLGWVAASPALVEQMAKVHQYAVSCLPAFTQGAAERALALDVGPVRASYLARRDLTLAALAQMGLPCVRPGGAFYAFPRVADLGLTSDDFALRAISEAGVAVVPGSCFSAEGYVRISYAFDAATLEEGLARLAGFVRGLRDA